MGGGIPKPALVGWGIKSTSEYAWEHREVWSKLNKTDAIKLLKNHGTEEVKERMARRFEQEARLISRLKDPHTITLYDFGKLPDGALFMVFEYVDGISLKELIESLGTGKLVFEANDSRSDH